MNSEYLHIVCVSIFPFLPTAYGYGFIMIFIISLMSLLGVSIVPFLRSNSRLATVYKYLITLLISMGVAALVSDALLHLIPGVSSLQ